MSQGHDRRMYLWVFGLFVHKRIIRRSQDTMGPYSKQGHDVCPERSLASFMSADGDPSNEGIGSTLMGDNSSSEFIFQFLSPRSSFRIRTGGEIRGFVLETSSEWGRPLYPDTLTTVIPGPLQMRSPQPCSQHSSYGSFLMKPPQQHPYHSSLMPLGWGHPTRSISCLMCLRLPYMLIEWCNCLAAPFTCVFRFWVLIK